MCSNNVRYRPNLENLSGGIYSNAPPCLFLSCDDLKQDGTSPRTDAVLAYSENTIDGTEMWCRDYYTSIRTLFLENILQC